MRRKKGIVCVLLCGAMLLFTGCGEEPYDLSDEDQAKVADYVAHVVTKYNGSQSEGIIAVEPEKIQPEEETKAETTEETEKEESAKKQEKKNTSAEEKTKTETVSLKKALKLEAGLDASFTRYDLTDSYVESDYFAMNAMSGKTYLVIHINLTAEGADTGCDMFSKNLNFRAVINGEKEVGAQTSILLNDLSTYQGTIAQGSPQDCVLLFETEKESVENIESLELKVLDGASSGLVKLQ
ncbi:MAG: hypothetical protein ACI4C5_10190 [Lachnospiraceae bacterium]